MLLDAKSLPFRVHERLKADRLMGQGTHSQLSHIPPLSMIATLFFLSHLSARAEGLDLVIDQSGTAMAEFVTRFSLDRFDVNAEHTEYLVYLDRLGETGTGNTVTRHSGFSVSGGFDLAENAELPLRFVADYQGFGFERHDLGFSLRSGLALPGLNMTSDLSLDQQFTQGGNSHPAVDGRLTVGFDWLGARHEGHLDLDVFPRAQATDLSFSSNWAFGNDMEAVLGFSHNPLEVLSEARLALRQQYGPISLGSDFAADSQGGYVLGVSFSLALAPTPKPKKWRLSTLLSTLSARQQDTIEDSFGLMAITESE